MGAAAGAVAGRVAAGAATKAAAGEAIAAEGGTAEAGNLGFLNKKNSSRKEKDAYENLRREMERKKFEREQAIWAQQDEDKKREVDERDKAETKEDDERAKAGKSELDKEREESKGKRKEKVKKVSAVFHGEAGKNAIFLFWIAIVFQIVDVVLLNFNRTVSMPTSVAMYVALTFFALLVMHKRGEFINLKQVFIFALLSAFYVLIPLFLYLIPKMNIIGSTSLFDWASFFLAFFPLWPIYIGLKAKIPFVHTYVNIWIVIILVIFLFGIGFKLSPGQAAKLGGRADVFQAGIVFNYLIEKGGETITNFWKSINPARIASTFLNSTGIAYYTGQVDNNEKAPIGLYLTNVRTIDKYFYAGSPVTMWADMRGKSFVEEIRVTPHCFIEDKYYGTAEPSSIAIFGEEHDTLSCTFDDLPKGSYLAKLTATFNFETWAYVTYTFVDIEVKRALELAGKNVISELDVDPLPRAVYSNGPVMLGMAAMVDQPVGIDTKYNTREPVLGVTLDNGWTDGKIEKSYGFVIQVPNDFELVKCDRGMPMVETGKEPGYDFYTFSREQLNDSRTQFTSVTCRLHVKDPAQLLGGAQKVERTFVTQAKYDYTLEKSVRLYVRE